VAEKALGRKPALPCLARDCPNAIVRIGGGGTVTNYVDVRGHGICVLFPVWVILRRLEPKVANRQESLMLQVVIYDLFKNILFHVRI